MSGHAGVGKDLLANSGTANGLEGLYGGNAAGVNSTLQPLLTSQAVAPTGESPNDIAAQTTAAEQTAGGANAGATGGAMLRAARTRNLGSGQAAISQAGQNAGQELSETNAGIQAKNAGVKVQQQRGMPKRGLKVSTEQTSVQVNRLSENPILR